MPSSRARSLLLSCLLVSPAVPAQAAADGAGAAVEFDCETAVVEGIPPDSCWDKFGRNVEALPGPAVAGKPTIQLLHQPAWGTGYFRDAVMLLAQEAGRYRILWSHDLVEFSVDGPGSEPGVAEAKVYKWEASPTGERIAVKGLFLKGEIGDLDAGEVVGERKELPAEAYCYSAAAGRFEACPQQQ